mmetsp:Transcript_52063/g.125682  ORF Transcript_52063/g.125682 Transcript_52063/m.125682 type:complete len:701 (+) Transcript_52063:428-2530(+)
MSSPHRQHLPVSADSNAVDADADVDMTAATTSEQAVAATLAARPASGTGPPTAVFAASAVAIDSSTVAVDEQNIFTQLRLQQQQPQPQNEDNTTAGNVNVNNRIAASFTTMRSTSFSSSSMSVDLDDDENDADAQRSQQSSSQQSSIDIDDDHHHHHRRQQQHHSSYTDMPSLSSFRSHDDKGSVGSSSLFSRSVGGSTGRGGGGGSGSGSGSVSGSGGSSSGTLLGSSSVSVSVSAGSGSGSRFGSSSVGGRRGSSHSNGGDSTHHSSVGGSATASTNNGNDSLPSLTSFRIDDLSTMSSYHSRGSYASVASSVNASVQEEGWSSFNDYDDGDCDLSGHGGDDEKDDGFDIGDCGYDDDVKIEGDSDAKSKPAASAAPSTKRTKTGTKPILKNKGEPGPYRPIHPRGDQQYPSVDSPLKSTDDDRKMSGPPKPPTRRRSREESDGGGDFASAMMNQFPQQSAFSEDTDDSLATRDAYGHDDYEEEDFEKPSLDRNDSMPFSELSERPALVSSSEQGSSSSGLRLDGSMSSASRSFGDCRPRLPRRTSTYNDESEHDEDDEKTSIDARSTDDGKKSERSSSEDEDLSFAIDGDGEEDSDCSVPSDTERDSDEDTGEDGMFGMALPDKFQSAIGFTNVLATNDEETRRNESKLDEPPRGVVRRLSSSRKSVKSSSSFGMIPTKRKGEDDNSEAKNRAVNSF